MLAGREYSQMQTIELTNSTWQLRLLPQWGGRIASLRAMSMNVLVPLEADQFDPLAWPKAGAYPLLPYSNRLRDARLHFQGREHALPAHPAALPHTLHGVAHTLAWHVESSSAKAMMIACDYQGEHWPWPVRFEQHFELEGSQLRITQRLINQGESPMPGGLGLHPYFLRQSGMRARFEAQHDWLIDSEYMPTGERRTLDEALQIDSNKTNEIAHYLSGWNGRMQLDYAQGMLNLEAAEPVSHLVAFAPAGAPYFCLEPVTHLADAFNASTSQWADVGTHVIAPGGVLEATLIFTWQPA